MRKRMAVLLAAIMLAGLVGAWAQADEIDLTGDWKMEYYGFPMYLTFSEDGTYEGVIDTVIQFDEGNGFAGTWELDGETLILHTDDEDQKFAWDGEKLVGEFSGEEIVMQRVEKAK